MRRPRCGTCRHWINNEGGFTFCALMPPTPMPGDEPSSAHPLVAHWGGCGQHKRHLLRSLKALWDRMLLRPGHDPMRIGKHMRRKRRKG